MQLIQQNPTSRGWLWHQKMQHFSNFIQELNSGIHLLHMRNEDTRYSRISNLMQDIGRTVQMLPGYACFHRLRYYQCIHWSGRVEKDCRPLIC